MNVCEILIEMLGDAGVRHIFGIPGDAINGLTEAIRKQSTVNFIQVRHEEAGAFAASAQAKLSGRLAVCVGTAGPGALHLLNGLYDAKRDHAPVLAVTGQVGTSHIGSDYHQEVDLYTLFKDVAVFNETIVSAEQVPKLVKLACQTAIARNGVAHLSLPVDIAGETARGESGRIVMDRAEMIPCPQPVAAAADLLNAAERVTILAGAGCQGASEQLCAAAERLQAPIIKTLRAKDILPDEHPLVVGGLGLLGTSPAVQAVERCDALLMAGTDFPYRNFLPDDTPAVQIDSAADRLGRRYPVSVGLLGHARPTFEALQERLTPKADGDHLGQAQRSMAKWFATQQEVETSNDEPINPQRLARVAGDLAADDAIFLCDTGAVTAWSARHLRIRQGQRFTLSSSLASMGFGLPGAIGASLAYPDRQAVALVGDGGLSMLLGDFLTCVKYELPITLVVFNNRKLGLIQMEQEVQGFPEYETALQDLDYGAFARLCGGDGTRVASPAALEGAIIEAYAAKKPWIVDVAVDGEALTIPPRIELEQAVGFGIAKAKEFLGLGDR